MTDVPLSVADIRHRGKPASNGDLAIFALHLQSLAISVRTALEMMNIDGNAHAGEAALDVLDQIEQLKADIDTLLRADGDI